MSAFLASPAWAVLLLSIKTSLVLGLAFLCTRRLAESRAGARHRVWAVALTVALLTPAGHLVARIELPILSPAATSTDAVRVPPAPSGVEDLRPDSAGPGDGATVVSTPGFSLSWLRAGALLYAVGALVVVFPLALGMFRASRLKRRGKPAVENPQWRDTLVEVADGLPPRASILASDAIHAPVTFGLLRPTILLPADVSGWTASHRHNAIVHELEHVARGDWLSQLVGALACAVYWFHPLVWFGARRLHLEAERACDERVVSVGSDPRDYAQQLVDLTRQHHRNPLAAAVAMASRSELADRVYSVLQTGRHPMESRRLATSLASLIVGLGVAVAAIVPTQATPPSRTASQAEESQSGVTPLMRAARDGDVDRVRDLLADGADLGATAGGRFTALILASAGGHADVTRALIDAGADVNQSVRGDWRDDLQRTALGAAARNGHHSVVEALLDAGARVDGHGRGDATALMEACSNDHYAIAKLLIERGADVNRQVKGDGNAAIAAARGGSLKMMRLLVDSGADVNAGVEGDGNALIMAVLKGDREMVEYLVQQGADPNAYVPGDETAMAAAAALGDRRIMKLLLDASGGE